jgi:TatA/E family protein of Tat protein translocase
VFGIGMSEMVVILAIALLVFGPNKLPEIAKQLAKGLKEIRKAGDDLKANLNFDLDDDRPQQRPQFRPPQRPVEVPPNIPGSTVADQLPANPADPAPPTTSAAPMTEASSSPSVVEQWPKPAEGAIAQGSETHDGKADEPKA